MTGRAIRLSYCRIAGRQDCRKDYRKAFPSAILQSCPSAISDGLAEEDLAEVVLEEERVGDSQAREEFDDVAVQQNRLAAAGGGVPAVPEVHFIGDDELGVERLARL